MKNNNLFYKHISVTFYMQKAKDALLVFTLFITIFSFYYFLSVSIPPFWEDHTFHNRFANAEISDLLKGTFHIGNNNLFYLDRPFFGMYFKIVFWLFKYNFFLHKIVKIALICLCAYVLYIFLRKMLKCSCYAFLITIFSFLSYPFFSNSLQYDLPFTLAELFKLLAIIILIIDIKKKETSFLRQTLIALFAVLAFRTYIQAWSVVGILILFVMIYNWRLLKRYSVLFLILITYNIPFGLLTGVKTMKLYDGLGHASIKDFFITRINVFYNPLSISQNIYYVSFFDILTFFGIWIIVSYMTIKTAHTIFTPKHFSKNNSQNYTMLVILAFVWLICELPILFIAPDPSIRYLSGIMIPFFILFFILVKDYVAISQKIGRKYIIPILIIALIGILATNVFYAYLFRITWGSTFIGIDKTNKYVEQIRSPNSYVLYFSGTVAREMYSLDRTSLDYSFRNDVIYYKGGYADFDENNINNLGKEYEEVYVIKRISTFGKSAYPDIDLDSYENLKLIAIINGNADDFIDMATGTFTELLKLPYTYGEIYVYKLQPVENN